MVTKNQLIISSIFNGGNFFFLLYYIYDAYMHPIDLYHLTRWCYYLNSIFTTIFLFCDIIIFISQKDENIESDFNYNLIMEKDIEMENDILSIIKRIDNWNKNKFGVICNTLGFYILLGFWLLYFIGNNIMLMSKSIKNVFNCIYHHIIIQIIILIDIFFFERKKHNFSWIYFGIIYLVFFIYSLIVAVEKYYFELNAYYFMDEVSNLFLGLLFIVSSIFLFLCYLLDIYILKIRNKMEHKNRNKNIEQLIDDSSENLYE